MPTNRKLVVIVVEAALEKRLSKDVISQGAKGFTITHANGLGPRNQRAGDLEGGNIKLETVVTEEIATKIMELLSTNYFPHYACSAWMSDVQILRDARY
jgi:hypothetical protein